MVSESPSETLSVGKSTNVLWSAESTVGIELCSSGISFYVRPSVIGYIDTHDHRCEIEKTGSVFEKICEKGMALSLEVVLFLNY